MAVFRSEPSDLYLEWLELHKDELLENWQLVEEKKPLKKIAPLE